MNHPDRMPVDLDHAPFGKDLGRVRLVVVAENSHHRRQCRAPAKPRSCEVAGVKNQIGLRKPTQTLVRQSASSTRQVGVGDDGELHAAG